MDSYTPKGGVEYYMLLSKVELFLHYWKPLILLLVYKGIKQPIMTANISDKSPGLVKSIVHNIADTNVTSSNDVTNFKIWYGM